MTGSAHGSNPQSVESRVIWLFGSPRSGSTWLRQMAEEHPAIEAMNEPTIGYHLSPFLSNEPGYRAEDLDVDTFTLRRVAADNPDRFFAAKYADVWLPGLRRLLNDRLLAHLEREVGAEAARRLPSPGEGAERIPVGGRDHARPARRRGSCSCSATVATSSTRSSLRSPSAAGRSAASATCAASARRSGSTS